MCLTKHIVDTDTIVVSVSLIYTQENSGNKLRFLLSGTICSRLQDSPGPVCGRCCYHIIRRNKAV